MTCGCGAWTLVYGPSDDDGETHLYPLPDPSLVRRTWNGATKAHTIERNRPRGRANLESESMATITAFHFITLDLGEPVRSLVFIVCARECPDIVERAPQTLAMLRSMSG